MFKCLKWSIGGMLILCLPALAFSQLTIQGKVMDEHGTPLPGANILMIGTSYGTASSEQGNYSLSIPTRSGDTVIEVHYLGYKIARRTVTQRAGTVDVNFNLEADALQMDEIVVTGQSVASGKRQLGNAISTVNTQQLEATGARSLDQALSGKVAGALVQQNSGNPAGGMTIRLRGTSTVLGNADPLYIIDGVIVNNDSPVLLLLGGYAQNRLVDLNPNDIERVEIVKGAAAAALYGSRANNGVVQIFTKRGAQGAPRITYTTRFLVQDVRKTLEVNKYPTDASGNPVERYDQQEFIFRNAIGTEQYLSINGGSGGTRYFASGSFFGNEGIIKGSNFQRTTARARIDQVIEDWGNISVGVTYSYNNSDEIPNGGLESNYGSLTGFIFGPNTYDPRPDPVTGKYSDAGVLANPVEVIDRYDFGQNVGRFIGSAQLNLAPLPGLSIDYTLGYDTYDQTAIGFIPRGTSAPGLLNGFSRRAEQSFLQLNNDLNIRYQTDLSSNLQSTTLVGATLQHEDVSIFSAESSQLSPVSEIVPSGTDQSIGEFRSKNTIYGFFAQQTFGLSNLFFLTGAARVDASSSFGENDRWQFYPKISASYLISENNFWQNGLASVFPSFKIRASVGASGGLTAIGAFDRFTNYSPVSFSGNAGLVPSTQLGALDVKPERQREIEVGADFALLSNKIGIEFTYYDQHTTDLLLERSVSPSTGFLNRLQNVGTLDNKGMEVLVRAIPFDRSSFRWVSMLTFSRNRNEVNGLEEDALILGGFGLVAAINSQPLGVFYGSHFGRNADGSVQIDASDLPVRIASSAIIGDPNPDFSGSFINEFQINRNLSFRSQFDFVWGQDVFNFTRRLAALSAFGTLKDYQEELEGKLPAGYNGRVFSIFENWIEDGSFVKLREISLEYMTYPNFAGLQSLKFSVIGRNLLSFDDYSGYDPEVNIGGQRTAIRGFDFVEVPIPRSFTFGVTASF